MRVFPFDVMMEGAMSVGKKERKKERKERNSSYLYFERQVCSLSPDFADGCLYVVTTPD